MKDLLAPGPAEIPGRYYIFIPHLRGETFVIYADDIRGPWSKPVKLDVKVLTRSCGGRRREALPVYQQWLDYPLSDDRTESYWKEPEGVRRLGISG